jgi:hypothetical protein
MMRVGSLKLIRVSSMLFMAGACAAAAASAQTSTTFAGDATALSGSVAGIPLSLAATGPIDPSGGARNSALVCYPGGTQCYVAVPDVTSGLLSAQLLNEATVGRGHQTYSNASVATLKLLVHGLLVKAEYVESIAKHLCDVQDPGTPPPAEFAPSGRSSVSELVIAGTPINVTGLPNQTVSVPSPLGGTITVVINEQTIDSSGITVRALHVRAPKVLGLVESTDVSVAKTHSKVDCGDVEDCFPEKVTSGGWLHHDGSKLTFAGAGKNGSDWGHFIAINHATGNKLEATKQLTLFVTEGDHGVAIITGKAQVNGGGSYDFTARLSDLGEPGTEDLFGLNVPGKTEFNVADRWIDGGNVQFHKPKDDCPLPGPPDVE